MSVAVLTIPRSCEPWPHRSSIDHQDRIARAAFHERSSALGTSRDRACQPKVGSSPDARWPWSPRSATGRWTRRVSAGWSSGTSTRGRRSSARWGRPANRRRCRTRNMSGSSRSSIEAAAGRAKVMAGTGSNSTAEAIRLTRFAARAGADAALSVAPYYNRPNQEGLYRHFAAIAECGRPADGALQHPRADGPERRAGDGRAAGEARADRGGEGSVRLARPGQRARWPGRT